MSEWIEWIEWSGRGSPVPWNTIIRVRQRNGRISIAPSQDYSWAQFGPSVPEGDSDIVAYHVCDEWISGKGWKIK